MSEQYFRLFKFFSLLLKGIDPLIIIAPLQKQMNLPTGKPRQKTYAQVLIPTKSH